MSEVDNIGVMAEKLANKIFKNFGWNKTGGWNFNWSCEKIKEHNKEIVKTHPADVVFHYADPYSSKNIYLHTDLKSYGTNTVSNMKLEPIINSLGQQIECAEISQDWKDKYLIKNKSYEIYGLLFIYNHDKDAEVDFSSKLSNLKHKEIKIPQNKKVFILDPKDIGWVTDISNQISLLKSENEIKADFSFFYDQRTFKAIDQFQRIATIEILKSNYIIIKSSKKSKVDNLKIFYRGLGETENEFQYLLDSLRHNGFLECTDNNIKIYFYHDCHSNASLNFTNSKVNYINTFLNTESDFSIDIQTCIENITVDALTHVDNSATYKENIIGLGER